MKRIIATMKNNIAFIYLISSIMSLEFLLKLFVGIKIFNIGLIYSFLFSVAIASIIYILFIILPKKLSKWFLIITMVLISLLFVSQLVYFSIFKTFYIAYSAGNAGKVFEFVGEAFYEIMKNLHFILILFIPLFYLIIRRNPILDKSKIDKSIIIKFALTSIILHMLAIFLINQGNKDTNSPYNLYYNIHQPEFSVENLGMLTYFRLDAKRQILSWEPKIDHEYIVSMNLVERNQMEENKNIQYNQIDIDFDSLIANETDPELVGMHEYFSSITPSEKNDFTGMFKDHNLIFITAEGFSHLAVKEDLTPTLYKMVHNGLYFENFYTSIWGVSTSDGEYVATNGLMPKAGVWSFSLSKDNFLPFSMGNQLKALGYITKAYHNHTYDYYDRDITHPNMGYDYKGIGNGLIMQDIWPRSDLEMMEITIPEFINEDKFHAYYMTVSGHLRYSFNGNAISRKNKDLVEDLDYSENAKAYLATQIELDRALEYLLEELKKSNKLQNTFIVLSTDHYPYGLDKDDLDQLNGSKIEESIELYKNNLIIYKEGMEHLVVSKPASSLDILPTISNLMGVEFDSRLLMGIDIFSNKSPFVIFSNRSFITDQGVYDSKNEEFILSGDATLSVDEIRDYIKRTSTIIDGKFYYSQKILEKDYYKKVLGD